MLKKEIIETEFAALNNMQFKAVTTVSGPLLILAGAGSGKTTVLVNRAANLIKYGSAYDSDHVPPLRDEDFHLMGAYLCALQSDGKPPAELCGDISRLMAVDAVQPWQLMVITFTNKAAGELKARLKTMLGEGGDEVWASTFHSTCARMLRRDAGRLGYSSSYTIYDADDSRRLMKDCLRDLGVPEKTLPARVVLGEISRCKDALISPEENLKTVYSDYRQKKIAEAYVMYQKRLAAADAMDFDDLIFNTVRLLRENADVLEHYQRRFCHIMVDEYQDTNKAQYEFIRLLAAKRRNICVVGDDDQSIYRFRGATVENILDFENQYKDAAIIRLEQNYRSTQNILNAANAVISHNSRRKEKKLWTEEGGGDKIGVYTALDEGDEARYVADAILDAVRAGGHFSDHAVLYRMNAQSNAVENVFMRSGIPYRVIGGLRFYERKEIKDVLAYLSVISNPSDSIRLKRIINEPKRGIGAASVDRAQEEADAAGITLFEVLRRADEYPSLARAARKMKDFAAMMEELISAASEKSLHELLELTLDKTGYMQMLVSGGEAEADRVDNVNELSSSILQYEKENEEASLEGFLEEISLFTDIDGYDEESDSVVLMTLHAAKGLEFPTVFMIGMEEGVFPGYKTIFEAPEEMEEERRLAYVGITRARRKLYLCCAQSRMIFGKTNRNRPSRFACEIPDECCDGSFAPPVQTIVPSAAAAAPGRSAHARTSAFAGAAPAKKTAAVSFSVGERVLHRTFGEGTVRKCTPMGNDVLLEIIFDTAGVKKLMANFAGLKRAEG